MTTKTCKALLKNGQPCPNQVDEGQDFCPYHLSRETSIWKKILAGITGVLGILVGILLVAIKIFGDSKKGK
ncbi:MAG: hypothetical protein KJ077_34410 [Anaerolineae bacterium]|nr:hypothetical protein [Anaerolineae bacterium]